MKQSILSLLGLVLCLGLNAQSDTTKPQGADTIKVGNMIIIKKHDSKEKKSEKDNDDEDNYDKDSIWDDNAVDGNNIDDKNEDEDDNDNNADR